MNGKIEHPVLPRFEIAGFLLANSYLINRFCLILPKFILQAEKNSLSVFGNCLLFNSVSLQDFSYFVLDLRILVGKDSNSNEDDLSRSSRFVHVNVYTL